MGHSSINVSLTYLRGLEIAELKEVMGEQEEIRKKLLFSYVEQTISMDDVAKQLNK